jgi:hypothetical protein
MLKVCHERCDQCLFSPGRIVSAERMAEILDTCERNDTHFICHKETLAGREGMCRGFYDKERYATPLMRMAAMLGVVVFIDADGQDVACPLPQGKATR